MLGKTGACLPIALILLPSAYCSEASEKAKITCGSLPWICNVADMLPKHQWCK